MSILNYLFSNTWLEHSSFLIFFLFFPFIFNNLLGALLIDLLGYALESPKPLVRASGFPCVTGNQFGRYGIEYQRLLDEAIEEFPP